MPSIVKGDPRPANPRKGKYIHHMHDVADTNSCLIFSMEELPSSGVRALRATAREYGYLLTVRTEGDSLRVWVRTNKKGAGK
jgi:hypothetical protein